MPSPFLPRLLNVYLVLGDNSLTVQGVLLFCQPDPYIWVTFWNNNPELSLLMLGGVREARTEMLVEVMFSKPSASGGAIKV